MNVCTLEKIEFRNLPPSISARNFNRNSEKICWWWGCVSLPLFQSFLFKFYMSKLSAHKISDLLFCLTLSQCLFFQSIQVGFRIW